MVEKKIRVPKLNSKLAEFVGIMLGDGNIYISKKSHVYQIKITSHSITDKIYLKEFVKPLVEKLFGLKAPIYPEKGKKANSLRLTSKKLVSFLLLIGLKEGDKIKNKVIIPRWILKKDKFTQACIRGLFDTDGTVFFHNKRSHRKSIGFKNYNQKLLRQVRVNVLRFGLHPTQITNKNVFYLSRQSEIKLFIKRIGFSNCKHLSKCKMSKSLRL